jgi:precorrin-4 methylase
MTVHFIGAGPGAADLITVRAARIIASAPVCLYAGALVPRELLATAPAGARLVDTAELDLDQITAELVAAHEAGSDVAHRRRAGGTGVRRRGGDAQARAHRARRRADGGAHANVGAFHPDAAR